MIDMENIATKDELKLAILLLEAEQQLKVVELKEKFKESYESIKPRNIIVSTLKEVVTSPSIIENLIVAGVGLATGYYTKRIVVGTATNVFRKLLGSALQVGVTRIVSKNADSLKSTGKYISKLFSRKNN
jgi:hypothetical protein